MPQGDADPRQQFAGIERLGEIVVRSGIERLDLVLLLFPRGYDDDRRLRPFAQSFGYFQAVEIGQAEIEEHHVGVARRRLHQALLRGRRLNQTIAVALERYPQEPPHLRFVFDQQYEFFVFSHVVNTQWSKCVKTRKRVMRI